MSLVWLDGFEGYGPSGAPVLLLGRRGYVVDDPYSAFSIVAGRSGYGLAATSVPCSVTTPAITTNSTMIAAFAFKPTVALTADALICAMYDGATLGMNLHQTATGELAVYLGTMLLATSSGAGLANGVFTFVEFKVVCGSSGSYEVRINGVTTLLTASGINTQAGSDAYHDRVLLGSDPYSLPVFDDFFVLDGAGSVNNDFIGNNKIVAIFPTSAGDSTQWTPLSGSNYAEVNANPPVDDSAYVEDATSGQEDLYNFGSVSGLGTVYGVQINTTARVTDVGSLTLKTAAKTSGTESDDAGQAVSSTSYLDFRRIMETDAGGSAAWTESSVNAAQFGINRESPERT